MTTLKKAVGYGSQWLATSLITITISGSALTAQTEKVIYGFPNSANGAVPESGLVMDSTGALYGTAPNGGSVSCGVVFKLSPPTAKSGSWAETTVYNFQCVPDGGHPVNFGRLVLSKTGSLYGTTEFGGEFYPGYGTVFQLSPGAGGTWNETVLYDFSTGTGTGGQNPAAGLTAGPKGLYGTTVNGGQFGYGAVFALSPPTQSGESWKETVLYSFTDGADGGFPEAAPVLDSKGNLYGTTPFGGLGDGVVYKLSPPTQGSTTWTETVLCNFDSPGGGGSPFGGVILDSAGALYGMGNGGKFQKGVVFQLVPPTWTENVLYNFTGGKDSGFPLGSLIFDSAGALYGTAGGGGGQNAGFGSAFKLSPPSSRGGAWTETTLHTFTEGNDGGTPYDGLLLEHGSLYGTASYGGSSGSGVVFQVRP